MKKTILITILCSLFSTTSFALRASTSPSNTKTGSPTQPVGGVIKTNVDELGNKVSTTVTPIKAPPGVTSTGSTAGALYDSRNKKIGDIIYYTGSSNNQVKNNTTTEPYKQIQPVIQPVVTTTNDKNKRVGPGTPCTTISCNGRPIAEPGPVQPVPPEPIKPVKPVVPPCSSISCNTGGPIRLPAPITPVTPGTPCSSISCGQPVHDMPISLPPATNLMK